METMKCLSLWQPWATLCAIGAKRIETRGWATPYRGPLAIHAAKRWTWEEKATCKTEPFRSALIAAGYRTLDEIPLGAVVAVARLTACERMTAPLIEMVEEPERSFGLYQPGRYMWMLEGVVRLEEPVPFRGAQGLFDVPRALLSVPA